MMFAVTADKMRKIEEAAMSGLFGITAEILMGLAGKAVADEVKKTFSPEKSVAVVCGSGNNGGDGFAAAAFLSAAGYRCSVICIGGNFEQKLSSASLCYYKICRNRSLLRSDVNELSAYDCILDCITGIGVKGSLRDEAAVWAEKISESGAYVISADIPSGLPSDGAFSGMTGAVCADCTVAMGFPKINCLLHPGRQFAGRIVIADIGFPCDCAADSSSAIVLDGDFPRSLRLAPPSPDGNKYSAGHIAVIGGFPGMEGAALMAAGAACAAGAGLVTIITDPESRGCIAGKIPEVMTVSIPEDRSLYEDFFTAYFLEKKVRLVLIGPGLGRDSRSSAVFHGAVKAAEKSPCRVILDGDALFFLAGEGRSCFSFCSLTITPHAGEAARLLG
ncbi:MAG: NAD(P)H-hydrate epimerase, partial [Spirochaetota bacterium]